MFDNKIKQKRFIKELLEKLWKCINCVETISFDKDDYDGDYL